MTAKGATKLGLVNVVLVTLFILLAWSPLGQQPGAIHPLLAPFFAWALISWLPAGAGLALSVLGFYRREKLGWVAGGLLLNASYLAIFGGYVVHKWPEWMGI